VRKLFEVRSRNAAALDRGVASGEFLAQTSLDTVGHRVNHVVIDLVRDFLGKIRCPVRHALTRKRGHVLAAEKRRAHGSGEYRNSSFHLLSLLSI